MNWFDIHPLDWQGILYVFLSGALIGLERQISGKPVGIRTSILICFGTYIFVRLGATRPLGEAFDSTRVLGQVITGVGFIGAGVMISRDGAILGVTSAATIWVLAGIGGAIGMGYGLNGLKMALLTLVVLVGINYLENSFKTLQHGVHKRLSLKKWEKQTLPGLLQDDTNGEETNGLAEEQKGLD